MWHRYYYPDQNKLDEVQLMITRNKSKVDKAFLKNALDQMLAGEQITKPVSKALGCSIKF